MEEKKAENELQMKREIKSLLEAYLQVKQRLEEIEGVPYGEEQYEEAHQPQEQQLFQRR